MTDTTDPSSATPRPIVEINTRVKRLVERHTKGETVVTQGLIRRFYKSDLDHFYFEMVENGYTIPCFLRNSVRPTIGFEIEKGLRVEVVGEIRVYDKEATIQIEVAQMRLIEKSGVPKPAELESQLRQQGLWRDKKHPLPHSVHKIAVVTSPSSEAYGDFETTYHKRGGQGQPFLAPVPLQGENAAQEIANTVRMFSRRSDVDVIVLTRGGGSRDELAVFNNPIIAEAIFHSSKPVITGIGHESDETLADRAGDLVAITPTDAALQLIAPPQAITRTVIPNWLFIVVGIGIFVIITLLLFIIVQG